MTSKRLKIEDLPLLEELLNDIKNKYSLEPEKLNVDSNFIYQNTALLEFQDRDLIKSTRDMMVHYSVFSFLAPTVMNLTLPNPFSPPVRNIIKVGLYIPPFLLFFFYYRETYKRLTSYEVLKYHERIRMFIDLNDRSILNPNYEKDDY